MSDYLRLVEIDEESDDYKRVRKQYFFMILFAHLDVWWMYKKNRQFRKIEDVVARKAVQHCVAQAARAIVAGRLIGLPLLWIFILVKATLLTDSFKGEERRYMNRTGPSWISYAKAQKMAKRSWLRSRLFSPAVITVASSVAHESLIDMAVLCRKVRIHGLGSLTNLEKARLVAHYLDDISVSDEWVKEPVDGRNILDLRIDNNIANPTYQRLNEQGRTEMRKEAVRRGLAELLDWPHNETTYEAQRRVGHMVEEVVAQLIVLHTGREVSPIDVPVFMDNIIRLELLHMTARRVARLQAAA